MLSVMRTLPRRKKSLVGRHSMILKICVRILGIGSLIIPMDMKSRSLKELGKTMDLLELSKGDAVIILDYYCVTTFFT